MTDDDIGGSVKVIPTEDAIDLMPAWASDCRPGDVRRFAKLLEEGGMIEPIDLDDWTGSFGQLKVHAAVHLGWETVIVTQRSPGN